MKYDNENDQNNVPKTGHIYDGIEELDHAVPNWFASLFYLCIAFAAGYFFYYSVGEGPTLRQEYERSRLADEMEQAAQLAKTGGVKSLSEDDLKAMAKDPEKIKLGAVTFQAKCLSCHGAQGQGGIGPNLTDAYWIHGGTLSAQMVVIQSGVGDKGMPPWGAILSADEVHSVVAYVHSLAGTHPPGPKEPQGELFKAE